jgi:hypothetical protein
LRFDSLVATSYVIKTEYLTVKKIRESDIISIESEKAITFLETEDNIIDFFFELLGKYNADVFNIFDDITNNAKIPEDHRKTLFSLY